MFLKLEENVLCCFGEIDDLSNFEKQIFSTLTGKNGDFFVVIKNPIKEFYNSEWFNFITNSEPQIKALKLEELNDGIPTFTIKFSSTISKDVKEKIKKLWF